MCHGSLTTKFRSTYSTVSPQTWLYCSGHAAAQLTQPQSSRLSNLVCNAAVCVAQQSQGHRRAVWASDLRVVRTGTVCCEPCHQRVEASSVGLCRRWRRTFLKFLMIATLKITMSKWQHCKFDKWRWLFVLFCCKSKWTKNNSVLTEKCYLNLRSKVRIQLRWCGKFYYSRM